MQQNLPQKVNKKMIILELTVTSFSLHFTLKRTQLFKQQQGSWIMRKIYKKEFNKITNKS